MHTFAETTVVQFGKLSEQEIAAYIATGTSAAKLFPPSKRLPARFGTCSVCSVCCLQTQSSCIDRVHCENRLCTSSPCACKVTVIYLHTFTSCLACQHAATCGYAGECYGKAGAYGIQGTASVFVKSIQGDYFNVMGFPLHSFAAFLADLINQRRL